MDKLDTCMVCAETFQKGDDTVVVKDAKYLGFYHDDEIATHEPLEILERGIYCQECYGSLVVYAWDLYKKSLIEKWRKEGLLKDRMAIYCVAVELDIDNLMPDEINTGTIATFEILNEAQEFAKNMVKMVRESGLTNMSFPDIGQGKPLSFFIDKWFSVNGEIEDLSIDFKGIKFEV